MSYLLQRVLCRRINIPVTKQRIKCFRLIVSSLLQCKTIMEKTVQLYGQSVVVGRVRPVTIVLVFVGNMGVTCSEQLAMCQVGTGSTAHANSKTIRPWRQQVGHRRSGGTAGNEGKLSDTFTNFAVVETSVIRTAHTLDEIRLRTVKIFYNHKKHMMREWKKSIECCQNKQRYYSSIVYLLTISCPEQTILLQ